MAGLSAFCALLLRVGALVGCPQRGLHVLRQNDWVDRINQNSTIAITVKEPEIEHRVRIIKDFENWLASNGKSPAEQALKTDLRALFNGTETKR